MLFTGRFQGRIVFYVVFTAAVMFFAGCSKAPEEKSAVVQTWASLHSYVPDGLNYPSAEYMLPEKFFPWAGTVSHHQLTDKLIDDWFYQIKIRRNVKNFIIICPSHFGLSTQDYSVADCIWDCGTYGVVKTNKRYAEKICRKLNVVFDNDVFPVEHGASCLMPYIKKHFPDAEVVVVAVNGEPPINMPYVEKLAECLGDFFTENRKGSDFLLISTDFAHHGTESQIAEKDKTSMFFFNKPVSENFLACGCDNRPGIYVLSKYLTKSSTAQILYHTNSFVLSGMDETDITSYYFTLFD